MSLTGALSNLIDGELEDDIEETDFKTAFKELKASFREHCYKRIKYYGEEEDIAWFFLLNMTGVKKSVWT
jgi:hypothetical protein